MGLPLESQTRSKNTHFLLWGKVRVGACCHHTFPYTEDESGEGLRFCGLSRCCSFEKYEVGDAHPKNDVQSLMMFHEGSNSVSSLPVLGYLANRAGLRAGSRPNFLVLMHKAVVNVYNEPLGTLY